MQSARLPDLRLTVLDIQQLLLDHVSGTELVRQSGHGALLPLLLSPRPGGSATAAIYETASGVVPKVRVEVKQRDAEKPELEFKAKLERVSIDEAVACASTVDTTSLRTRIVIAGAAGGASVVIATEQRWTCEDDTLQTP
jgi:hypothetical protein